MILENGKEQSKKELEKRRRETEHAAEAAKAAAAKILELECEVARLQDAYAQATAEDEAAQAEAERLNTVQKARRERQTSFRIHSEDEEEDGYKRGQRPSEWDEGSAWHDSWEDDEVPA